MKISIKVIVVVVSLAGGVLLANSLLEIRSRVDELKQSLDKEAINTLVQIEASIKRSLWETDVDSAKVAIRNAVELTNIESIAVYDHLGELFIASRKQRGPSGNNIASSHEDSGFPKKINEHLKSVDPEKPLIEFKHKETIPISVPLQEKPNLFLVKGSLFTFENNDSKFLGNYVLRYSTENLAKLTHDLIIRSLLFTFLLVLIISSVIIVFINKTLLKSIIALSKASVQASKKNFIKVPPPKSRDEISLLVKNYNTMVGNIATHIKNQDYLAEATRMCSKSLTFEDLQESSQKAFSLIAEEEVRLNICVHSFTQSSHTQTYPIEIPILGSDGQEVGIVQLESLSTEEKAQMCLPIFKALTTFIASIVRNIEYAIEQKKHGKLESELSALKAIQDTLLQEPILLPEIQLLAHYKPADETGGDWYGYHIYKEKKLGFFFVGDVTGHGIPSALLAGVVCGAVMAGEKRIDIIENHTVTPGERLLHGIQVLNSVVCSTGARSSKLMTMFAICIDYESGKLWGVNAGHCLPILISQDGSSRLLKGTGSRLGWKMDSLFEVQEVQLKPGDVVCLYTDGLLENSGPQNELFSLKALRKYITQCVIEKTNLEDVLSSIVNKTHDIWRDNPMDDDVTIVAIKWVGKDQQNVA